MQFLNVFDFPDIQSILTKLVHWGHMCNVYTDMLLLELNDLYIEP